MWFFTLSLDQDGEEVESSPYTAGKPKKLETFGNLESQEIAKAMTEALQ